MSINNIPIKKHDKKVKRLLCISGGGVRGLIPIYFLLDLEKDLIASGLYSSIFDAFDFYAGTSVGSIITGAIVYTEAKNMAELVDKYFSKENFQKIFNRTYIDTVLDLFMNRPKYSGSYKESLIKEAVGSQRLCDHNGKHIMFTTYCIDEQKAKFFKSYKLPKDILSYQNCFQVTHGSIEDTATFLDDDDFTKVAEIVNASSAAPSYFPASEYTDSTGLHVGIDGAIFANNPSDAAYADALQLYGPKTDIRILSIGTGSHHYKRVGPEAIQWGLEQWVLKGSLLDIILGLNEDVSAYKTKYFAEALGHAYVFIEKTDDNIELDDITKIDELIQMGHEWYLSSKDEVLREIFDS